MVDWLAMRAFYLRSVYALDQLRFMPKRVRFGQQLRLESGTTSNLRLAKLRIEPGGVVEIGPGFATERQPGNSIWVQRDGRLLLGADCWLRTEYGTNHITVFPGSRIHVGHGAIINGAMLHAKQEIRIGDDARLAFGVRIIDADLHPIDSETPERIAPIHIGDRVWLGADVKVLRGVSIGDDVVVGTGSVVSRDLPPRVLAIGSPAEPVKELASRKGCP